MTEYLNLSNYTLTAIGNELYLKEQVQQCFAQQSQYASCVKSGNLELLIIILIVIMTLIFIKDIIKNMKGWKKNSKPGNSRSSGLAG